ncbi:MAG: sialate O-acetylesterase [Dysgonamonadaceae bacterium]|nr:sialate O-acetylesterase [Dysgonamonadaceae bacterium]
MKKTILLFFIFPFLLNAQKDDERAQFFPKQEIVVDKLPEKEKLWVFILAGQSNMAGRGFIEPQDTLPHKNIFTLNKENVCILAKEPLHYYEPKLTGLDCGMSFGRNLVKDLKDDISIVLIPTAVGGSSVSYWLNDSIFRNVNLRSNLIEKIEWAKEHGTLKGVLWHQGENDATVEKATKYECDLKKLFYLMRYVADDSQLPIVVGELAPFSKKEEVRKNYARITNIIYKVAIDDKNIRIVKTSDLKPMSDFIHFDSPSLRIMGERYAQEFIEVLKEKNPASFKTN